MSITLLNAALVKTILPLTAITACPPVGDQATLTDAYLTQTDHDWAIVRTTEPPESSGGDPADTGRWLAPQSWPVTAIHGTVLPTGEVLHYSYPSATVGSRARTWNPATGVFSPVDIDVDLFCSGHSYLEDGTLLVTGGNDSGCDFRGFAFIHRFDPVAGTWTRLQDMIDGRWYPSNVTLPDGRVLIMSGLNRLCEPNPIMEIFDPAEGVSIVPNGQREVALYPRLHLLSDGRIAHVGPEFHTYTYTLAGGWEYELSNSTWRSQGTSVLLPGFTDRVMILGGNSPLNNTAEIIDFSGPVATSAFTAPLNYPRAHADALILPDKTVMVVGGGQFDLYDQPINIPELYDPQTETWTDLPPHVYGRMYHSTTLLLPDGRVLCAGQDNGQSPFFAEIYEPAYLFQGPRPVITSAPAVVAYDGTYDIGTPDNNISAAHLIRLSSVTHSVNFEQRLVELTVGVPAGGSGVSIVLPDSDTLAPPGNYMLFLMNDQGVPSEAAMMRLVHQIAGDATGDGVVNVLDLLAVLAAWGPCPGCDEDVNNDGTVNVLDVLDVLAQWS